MENYNGIAISKNDKEFVVAFDNFVNGKMQSATNTGKALATIHRYLQSQAFKVCVAYFRQLAVNYRTGYYDERNETAARRAAMMYDTLMNGDEIYDPKYLWMFQRVCKYTLVFFFTVRRRTLQRATTSKCVPIQPKPRSTEPEVFETSSSNSLWQPMCHRKRISIPPCQGGAKKVSLWQGTFNRVRSRPSTLPK